MYLVGESLNSSSIRARALLEAEDCAPLADILALQKECGANACDINTALCANPTDSMYRACRMTLDVGMSAWMDSSDARLMERMLDLIDGDITINSVTSAPVYDRVIACAAERSLKVVAMPRGGASPIDEALRLTDKLTKAGIDEANIYLDIMSGALIASDTAALDAIHFLAEIKLRFPGLMTLCGISNISYGLPERNLLNAAFLTALATHGLDAIICDVQKTAIREAVAVSELLCGRDEFCAEYVATLKKEKQKA